MLGQITTWAQSNMILIAVAILGCILVFNFVKGVVKWALLLGIAACVCSYLGVF